MLNIFAAAFFYYSFELFVSFFVWSFTHCCSLCMCMIFSLSLSAAFELLLNAIVMYRNRLIVIFYKCSYMSLLCYCTRCFTVDLAKSFRNAQSKRQRMLLFFPIEHPSTDLNELCSICGRAVIAHLWENFFVRIFCHAIQIECLHSKHSTVSNEKHTVQCKCNKMDHNVCEYSYDNWTHYNYYPEISIEQMLIIDLIESKS